MTERCLHVGFRLMSDIKVGWLAFRITDIVRAVPRYHLEPRVG